MAIPVTLVDARRQLKLEADDTSLDAELSGFIRRAAGWVEDYTGAILTARDVTLALPAFDAPLPVWPVAAGAGAVVAYGALDATPTVIIGSGVLTMSRPARLRRPAALASWPTLRSGDLVTVTVRAGYEEGEEVPANLASAMLVLIAAYDADREGGDTFAKAVIAARTLCAKFKLRRV